MRFNLKSRKQKGDTRNHEGATAFLMTPELELYAAVATASLSDKFYEKADTRLARIRDLMTKVDPVFAAKLAVYAREKMYLRSIPVVMAVELAKVHKGDLLVSRLVERVVQRVDEIPEMLAYYQMTNERKGLKKLNKLSKQLQKGLGAAFNKFDEYQFAKYNRDAEIKLKDALFLVHPKPKSEVQQTIFDKIVSDSLEKPMTWEVQMSQTGQQKFDSAEDKEKAMANTWEQMIDSKKMGYMAMLRNLRNFLEREISDEHLARVAERLSDRRQVQRSRQFPFRFLAAYRELSKVGKFGSSGLMEALEKAIKASIENVKGFDSDTRVLIACDMSGSMQRSISGQSTIMTYDVALVLGMLLQSKCRKVITGIFGNTWKKIQLPQANILQNADGLGRRLGEVGHSTNGYLIIKDLIETKTVMDKVMIFSDMQLWDSAWGTEQISAYWDKYKQIAPGAKLYLFDLAGYGQAPLNIKRSDVFMIAGWSDKVFDVMESIERGEDALTEVRKVEI